MRDRVLRVMAAALMLPLAACVEPPTRSAPPGYAIGADGQVWLAPPPRSRHVDGGPVYVPPVDAPRASHPRSIYPPAYYPPGYYPRSVYPPAHYPPAFFAPSRPPSFWGPGWRDRHYRDLEEPRKKAKKRRDRPDRAPVVQPGDDPPRPDTPKPERAKPPKRKLLFVPRSGSGAAESRGHR